MTHDMRPVRQLAARLRVNPATVVQAYRALETEGFVEMRQGVGTYIMEVGSERQQRERDEHAVRLVRQLLTEAARHGVSPDLLRDAFLRELDGEAA